MKGFILESRGRFFCFRNSSIFWSPHREDAFMFPSSYSAKKMAKRVKQNPVLIHPISNSAKPDGV